MAMLLKTIEPIHKKNMMQCRERKDEQCIRNFLFTFGKMAFSKVPYKILI
jgi:hypothetical protein